MKVKQKSIRTLTKLGIFKDYEKLHFIYKIKENDELIKKVGFSTTNVGDTIIPLPNGKYTKLNSIGAEVKLKDLPKVPKDIMYEWTQTDWQGNKNLMLSSRSIDVYQTSFIEPNEEELIIVELENEKYVSTRIFSFDDEHVLELANIMLESFGEFEVYDAENNEIIVNKHKRLKWDILPKGEHPWEKVLERIQDNTKHLKKKEINVIEKRLELLHKRNPTFIASGLDSFYGYFVFAFEDIGIYILESSRFNNATYVFDDDWESFSNLSKKEILDNDYQKERIIHDKFWWTKISKLFRK